MITPDRLRTLAEQAFADADSYCIEAERSREPRRSLLLKWADERESTGNFYNSKAASDEAFAAFRSGQKQKDAA